MDSKKLSRIGHALIRHSRLDVELHVVEKAFRHSLQTFWSISVNVRRSFRLPRVVEQRAVFEIVIRMMMCDENVAQPVERHAGANQLSRNSVAAVDDVRNVVD